MTSLKTGRLMCLTMKAHLLALSRTLAIGFIFYFWSERVFWSFWRAGDSLQDAVTTWLAYSLIAAVTIALMRTYRVASFAPLFLTGAVYGWLTEGVLVDTTYGNGTNPLPLSLSFTGLSWHALLSVCLGWWWLGKALAAHDFRMIARRSSLLGIGWGLWGIWWQTEPKAIPSLSPAAFLVHAFGYSLLFCVAWLVLGRLRAPSAPPTRREWTVLLTITLSFFLLVRVPATPIAALILPPLLLLCVMGLRRSVQRAAPPDVLAQTMGNFGIRQCLPLLFLPLSAGSVYTAFYWTKLPTNVLLYVLTMPLGFWYFGRSLWVTLRPGKPST